MEKGDEPNWSEAVEDLVTAGDTDGAITLLETLVSKLQTLNSSSESSRLQLSSALFELAELYSSNGFSFKADELRSRASLIKHQCFPSRDAETVKKDAKEDQISLLNVALLCNDSVQDGSSSDGHFGESTKLPDDALLSNGSLDDDWEAIADRVPVDVLPLPCLSEFSNISLQDTKVQNPKRRGRGTFSYRKHELYSDHHSDKSVIDDIEDEDVSHNSGGNTETKHSLYGTRHVLVLADFPPSTRTIELEKLLEDFGDRGVVIRWVNDTTALAVFRTPSIALEARNRIRCSFTVRVLDEDDILLGSISKKDLEPPRQRPQTSARTAQRLIAQGMGLKLPLTSFSSRELKNQEEARKNRIVTRQKLKDDAWGAD